MSHLFDVYPLYDIEPVKARGSYPVSYTHLDVYKRQDQYFPKMEQSVTLIYILLVKYL